MRNLIITSIISTAMMGFAACDGGGGSAKPTDVPSFTLTGVMMLVERHGWTGPEDPVSDAPISSITPQPPPSCTGSGGYRDLRPAAQVTVKDDQSAIIGVGQFTSGTAAQGEISVLRYYVDAQAGTAGHITGMVYDACQFSFAVSRLPRRPFYVISVGTRAGVTYNFDDLASKNWAVSLTTGGD